MTTAAAAPAPERARLDTLALLTLFGMAGTLQFSIAISQSLLAISIAAWLVLLVTGRVQFAAPRFFWVLVAYAALTLLSALVSPEPRVSLVDCKQLVLFLIVPLTYEVARGRRAELMTTVILSFAAASAAVGIFQYAILHYDNLHLRPQGTLGHYMTYSGLLMLVIGVALARILFGRRDRLWSILVLPALAVAVTITLSRSAWVGVCAAAALLLALKDFRLLAILPIVAAIFFGIAGSTVTKRFSSIFDMKDPSNRDRLAMLREGGHMIRTHPLLGIGPNMVQPLYAEYRDPDAVEKVNPHLHNVPVQIAAERGLPALGVWLWFIASLMIALVPRVRHGDQRFLAASALAALISMLAAGFFEYNFGDSEFLMLFLVLVTLPFAAARSSKPRTSAASEPRERSGDRGVPAPRRRSGRPEQESKGASERVGGSGGAEPSS